MTGLSIEIALQMGSRCCFSSAPFLDKYIFDAYIQFSANSPESVTECLRRMLNNSEVKVILSEATTEGGEAVVARYLHDFTHMTYKPQDDDEIEVTVH